ncbi:hypothetical protein CEXT_711361 [Caerostris extrusa]|uniref:Uncharacterized protein n=1 Tax=Caerostris extrusa TaxID=172846 RepID=A0AAV4Y2L2_CAEEX|nr:hypothetical protein CEXT_711361 [Caerostris extrusa]
MCIYDDKDLDRHQNAIKVVKNWRIKIMEKTKIPAFASCRLEVAIYSSIKPFVDQGDVTVELCCHFLLRINVRDIAKSLSTNGGRPSAFRLQ